eukprot:scaffold87765_cov62-Phaeocystis_antarctica.AAC.7
MDATQARSNSTRMALPVLAWSGARQEVPRAGDRVWVLSGCHMGRASACESMDYGGLDRSHKCPSQPPLAGRFRR